MRQIWLAAALLCVAAMVSGPVRAAAPQQTPQDRVLGQADAPLTIIEYASLTCPHCAEFDKDTLPQIKKNWIDTGKAKLVWHDFTIIDRNDHAVASRDAANAAFCGADQGKFWVMHDWLYANQSMTEDASAFTTDRLFASTIPIHAMLMPPKSTATRQISRNRTSGVALCTVARLQRIRAELIWLSR